MAKKYRLMAWLMTITLLILFVSPVSAASKATNPGFTIWSGQKTTEVRKVWTISFNTSLSSKSVNSNTIYVTDSKQEKVSTRVALVGDGSSVTVTPSKEYKDGDYNLYILAGIEAANGAQLQEMIIMPFTVIVPSLYTPHVELVVSVKDDFKASFDSGGRLTLEGTKNKYGPISYDKSTGKYTFKVYAEDDYSLKYYDADNGVLTTQYMKVNTLKMPVQKDKYTETKTTKNVTFVVSSKVGLDGGKAGCIGGGTTYTGDPGWVGQSVPRAGVDVKVYNNTTTWTTKTDLNGDYKIYLPKGTYTLIVYGNGSQYKDHTFTKMKVSDGQMTTPQETVNVEEPLD